MGLSFLLRFFSWCLVQFFLALQQGVAAAHPLGGRLAATIGARALAVVPRAAVPRGDAGAGRRGMGWASVAARASRRLLALALPSQGWHPPPHRPHDGGKGPTICGFCGGGWRRARRGRVCSSSNALHPAQVVAPPRPQHDERTFLAVFPARYPHSSPHAPALALRVFQLAAAPHA